MVHLPQIVAQQRSRPHARAIAQLPRVPLDHRRNQRVNDPMDGAGAASVLAWCQASRHIEDMALLEAGHPLVECLARDPQAGGHLLHSFPFSEPQQGLRPTQEPRVSGVSSERFQGLPVFLVEGEQSHRCTSSLAGETMTHYTCKRNF